MDALTLVTMGVGAAAGGVMKGAAAEGRAFIEGAEAAGGKLAPTFADVASGLEKTGKGILKQTITSIGEKGFKAAGKDALEFGLAKVPKFVGANKIAAFGKDALSEENAFGDVFTVMKAKGIENFKNMSVLNLLDDVPKGVKVMNGISKWEGIGNMVVHQGVKQYDAHTQLFNGLGHDAGNYAKDLGKFMANNPGLVAMRAGY
jgi:hypothetical protein